MKKFYWLFIGMGVLMAGCLTILNYINRIKAEKLVVETSLVKLKTEFEKVKNDFESLKQSDQIKINNELKSQISEVDKSYKDSLQIYETMLDLTKKGDTEKQWAAVLADLSKNDFKSANDKLAKLKLAIDKIKTESAAVSISTNLPISNNPPLSGFAKQVVEVDSKKYVVDIVTADLKSSKLIVDTASNSDCNDNCPVNSLDVYAKRNGAYAAINGPYFCPDTYPACQSKKNSFDTLLMNKNKTYFNSSNNVYSSNPVAIFSTTSRFIDQGSGWGRDTGVDSVIMGRPLLVYNNSIMFGGNNDIKETSVGNRAFIGGTDSTVYIGVVHGVTVAEMAKVIQKMGIRNAINLDSGGSLAMWVNGKYINGPGRNLPFGLLLVKR